MVAETEMKHPGAYLRFGLAAACVIALSGCKGINIDVGTEEAIKLDPIKFEPIDVRMRVDVYQYTGETPEEKEAAMNKSKVNERLRNRMAEIQELKNNRLVGENRHGLLHIRNLPAGDYGDYVRKTVDDENADRVFMMTEKANTDRTALAAVQTENWRRRIQSAFEGEWIEVEGDDEGTYRWVQKD